MTSHQHQHYPPHDDQTYVQKYKELKQRVKEIEQDNDRLHIKVLKTKKNIQRLRIERAILYDRLASMPNPVLNPNTHPDQLMTHPQQYSPHDHPQTYPPPPPDIKDRRLREPPSPFVHSRPPSPPHHYASPNPVNPPPQHDLHPPPPPNRVRRAPPPPPPPPHHPQAGPSRTPTLPPPPPFNDTHYLPGPGLPPMRTHPEAPPPPPPQGGHNGYAQPPHHQYLAPDDRGPPWEREREREQEREYNFPPMRERDQAVSNGYGPPPPQHRYEPPRPQQGNGSPIGTRPRGSSQSYTREYPPPPPPPAPPHVQQPPHHPYDYPPAHGRKRSFTEVDEYDERTRHLRRDQGRDERERDGHDVVPRVREGETME